MINFYKSQFLLLVVSWLAIVLFIVFGGVVLSSAFKLFMIFIAWIPGLLAIFYAKKEGITLPILKSSGKVLFVLALGVCTIALAFLFSLPFCMIRPVSSMKTLFPFIQYSLNASNTLSTLLFSSQVLMMLAVSFVYYSIIAVGQELMFRGYAWEKLKTLGFWRASWLIGLIFGVWVTPIVLIGMEYSAPDLMCVVVRISICVLVSPIMIYMRVISKGLLVPILYFGTIRSLSNLFPLLFQNADYLYLSMQGFVGIFSLLFINLILFLKTRKTPFLEYEL